MKKKIFIFSLITILVIPLAVVYAGEISDSPQSECNGYDYWRKFNSKGELSEQNTDANPINLTMTTLKEGGEYIGFEWRSQEGIAKITVKAGNDGSNIYEFDAPYPTSGTGSTDNNKAISHITFCWNESKPDPTPEPTPTHTSTPTEEPTPEPDPKIVLEKSANPSTFSEVGNTINYSYVITNTGNVPLYPPYSISDDKANVSCPAEPANLAVGSSVTCSAVYTITQADLNAGSVTNTAVATAKDEAGADVVSNQDSATVTAEQNKSLTLDKDASPKNYANVGESIEYSYLLTNNGNVALTGPFSVSDDKTSVSCPDEPASLQPSESLTCSATYVITEDDLAAGSVTNTAIAYAEGGNVVSNTDSVTVEGPKANPDIQLVKEVAAVNGDPSVSNFEKSGDTISYKFTVTNTGNVELTDVTITDPKASVVGGPITLAAGASDNSTFTATYVITQTDVDAGAFTNTATVTGTPPSGDPVSSKDTATIEGPNQVASIQIVKNVVSVSGDTAFKYMLYPGDVITYSFIVTNTGNVELTNVTISDPGADVTGDPIPSLLPGESDNSTFSATYTVTKADLEAGQYTNTVTVTGTTPNGGTVTDQDSAIVEKAQLY
jgi:hypothetical protein